MNQPTIIKNPGPFDMGSSIYHCWHFCDKCGKSFTHTQSSWDYVIKKHSCGDGDNIRTVPSMVDEVKIILKD